MSDLPNWIRAIIDLILRPKFLFVIWFLGGLILFMPKVISDWLGFAQAIDPYRGWIGFATLAGFIFWLVQLNPWTRFMKWLSDYRKRSQIDQDLMTLSSEEKLRLAFCLDRNQQFIVLHIDEPEAISLRQKSLLVLGSSSGPFINIYRTHRVPELVWKQLQKNKSKLFQESFWHAPQIRHRFDQFSNNQRNPLAGPDF